MRSSITHGSPLLTVNRMKQRTIIAVTQDFLNGHPQFSGYRVRFDVVAVTPNDPGSSKFPGYWTPRYQFEWIKCAFNAEAY